MLAGDDQSIRDTTPPPKALPDGEALPAGSAALPAGSEAFPAGSKAHLA